MANYAKNLPRDTGGAAMTSYPPVVKAQARYNSTNASASSVVTLNPNTTSLEIGAYGGQGVVIRWVPLTETAMASSVWNASIVSSGLGANYDHWIAPGTARQFVVPKETQGLPTGQAGSVNGLYQRVAWVNAGLTASSVIASEF